MPATLSVIIPTADRKEVLRECLHSLLRQDRSPDEIIVVDNLSTDGTDKMVQRDFKDSVRHVLEPERGVHHARNRGIREAMGDILVFTNDDVLAPPEWLSAVESCFRDPTVGGAGGPTKPLWPSKPRPSWLRSRRTLNCLGIIDYGKHTKLLNPAEEFLLGENFAVRKKILQDGNGFRAVFPCPMFGVCGDDYEFSRRIAREHRVVYEPAAFVHHRILPHKMAWTDLLMRAFYFEAANVQLGHKLKPKRKIHELLGTEGAVSIAVTLGHLYGIGYSQLSRLMIP